MDLFQKELPSIALDVLRKSLPIARSIDSEEYQKVSDLINQLEGNYHLLTHNKTLMKELTERFNKQQQKTEKVQKSYIVADSMIQTLKSKIYQQFYKGRDKQDESNSEQYRQAVSRFCRSKMNGANFCSNLESLSQKWLKFLKEGRFSTSREILAEIERNGTDSEKKGLYFLSKPYQFLQITFQEKAFSSENIVKWKRLGNHFTSKFRQECILTRIFVA